jgi:hypothetical protein
MMHGIAGGAHDREGPRARHGGAGRGRRRRRRWRDDPAQVLAARQLERDVRPAGHLAGIHRMHDARVTGQGGRQLLLDRELRERLLVTGEVRVQALDRGDLIAPAGAPDFSEPTDGDQRLELPGSERFGHGPA